MSIQKRFLGRGVLPLAVALAVAAAAPALAQEPTAMQKIFGALGMIELPSDPIDYRERAPLVVPPSSALVSPRSPEDMARYNPDWPVDHDVRNGRRSDSQAMSTDNDFYSGDRIGAVGLQRGRLSRQEGARREAVNRGIETAGQLDATGQVHLGPDGLGFKGWGNKKEQTVVFTGEPERQSLTEPPPGLLTPSTNAPYGVLSNRPEPVNRRYDRSASQDDPALNR